MLLLHAVVKEPALMRDLVPAMRDSQALIAAFKVNLITTPILNYYSNSQYFTEIPISKDTILLG